MRREVPRRVGGRPQDAADQRPSPLSGNSVFVGKTNLSRGCGFAATSLGQAESLPTEYQKPLYFEGILAWVRFREPSVI